MKSRIVALLGGLALALAACSLADDITPPPSYVSPTPAPTLGALHPALPPSPARGFAIYGQDCAPCHGDDGLGNGPLAPRMPVAVPAIGLRVIASQVAPADWFAIVTQGRLDRGMPPFISLSEAEKWDVLAYVFSLSSTPQEGQRGADLYAANCTECHGANGRLDPTADLADPAFMARATGTGMYHLINGEGGSNHPFAGQFSEDELWDLVGYVRSLAFDLAPAAAAVQATQTPETASPTPESGQATAAAETPATETSPTPAVQTLEIAGTVTNESGGALSPGLVADLHLHDTTTGQETQSVTVPVGQDGTYRFEGIQADLNLVYWVSVDYADVTYESGPVVYDGTNPEIETQISVYESTQELSSLTLDQVHIYLDFSADGIVQIVEIYALSNPGSRTVVIPTDGETIPFIQTPAGAANLEFQLSPDSAPFSGAAVGVAMVPTSRQYGVVALYTLPYDRKLEFSHPFSMPVASVVLLLPQGVRVQSDLLTDSGTQDFQGQAIHLYQADNLASGSTFSVTVSGNPGAGPGTALNGENALLIGLAAVGLVLIGAGVYLYLRDRNRARVEEPGEAAEEDSLGEDRDAILDAIIVLDDQYKAGDLRKVAYEKRRQELKDRLKGKV